jgi:hypothetical protein
MKLMRISSGNAWIYPELRWNSGSVNLSSEFKISFKVRALQFQKPLILKLHLRDKKGKVLHSPNGIQWSGKPGVITFERKDFPEKDNELNWNEILSLTFGFSLKNGENPPSEIIIEKVYMESKVQKEEMSYSSFKFPNDINVYTEGDNISITSTCRGNIDIVNGLGEKILKIKLNSKGKAELGKLPAGFYRIKTDGKYINYFTVVVPFDEYPLESGNVFGVDYGMSTAPSWSAHEMRRATKMAKMAGLTYVRERLNVVDIYKKYTPEDNITGKWMTKTKNAYRADAEAGLKIVAKFLETPAIFRKDGNIRKTPDDLFDTVKMLESLDGNLGEWIHDWEVFNEVNLRNFYEGTAWELASFQKVCYLTLKKLSPKCLILGPSYSQPAPSLRDLLYKNGMSAYFDVENFHTYSTLESAHGYSSDFIINTDKLFKTEKPVWCTETGIAMENIHADDCNPKAIKELRKHAINIGPIMSNIVAAGVDKVFYFYWKPVYTFLCVLDRYFMTTECYAAIATLNRMLGGAYAGSIIEGSITVHRFNTSKGPRIIVFSSKYPAEISLKASGIYKIISMTGETIRSDRTNNDRINIKLKSEPVYVSAESFMDNFKSLAVKRTTANKVTEKSSIILDPRIEAAGKYNSSSASIEMHPGQILRGTLYIYNLADSDYNGIVCTSIIGEYKLKLDDNKIDVKGGKRQAIEFSIEAPEKTLSSQTPGEICITTDKGKSVTTMRFSIDKRYLIPEKEVKLFPSLKDMEWSVNKTNSLQHESFQKLSDGKLSFKVDFKENGQRMFWPVSKHFPDNKEKLDIGNYDAICFEVDIQKIRQGTWFMCTLTETNGARYGSSDRIYCDKPGKVKMVFPFSYFVYLTNKSAFDGPDFVLNLDRIKNIALGLNTNKKHLSNFSTQYSIEYTINDITLIKY